MLVSWKKKGHVYLSTTIRLANPGTYFYFQLYSLCFLISVSAQPKEVEPLSPSQDSLSAHCMVSPATVKFYCNVIAWSHSAITQWQ